MELVLASQILGGGGGGGGGTSATYNIMLNPWEKHTCFVANHPGPIPKV